MSYNLEQFKDGLKELQIELNEKQISQFLKYYELLVETNKVMNLTGITEYEEVNEKHFLDSLALVKAFDPEKATRLIDVGTGAGFPGGTCPRSTGPGRPCGSATAAMPRTAPGTGCWRRSWPMC